MDVASVTDVSFSLMDVNHKLVVKSVSVKPCVAFENECRHANNHLVSALVTESAGGEGESDLNMLHTILTVAIKVFDKIEHHDGDLPDVVGTEAIVHHSDGV